MKSSAEEKKISNYLKSILNAFHDMLFVFSEDGVIDDYLTTNQKDELVQPKEVFLGKHYRDVLPDHVSFKIEKAFEALDLGTEQYKFDYSIELNGEKQWYAAVLSRIESEGKPKYLGTVRNITKRKNYELLLKEILNTSPAGIMVFKAVRDDSNAITDFKITHISRLVEKISGVTEQQLIGHTLTKAEPDIAKQKLIERLKTVSKTGNPVNFEYQLAYASDQPRCYLCKAVKFKDGVLVSFLDITDRKEAEEKLITNNEKLEELNRQKDKLFSVISHDLKNAFSGFVGTFGMLVEDYEEFSKEELYEYLKLLNERSKNTSELLEDLLLWSKNQFKNVTANREELNLFEITNSVFSTLESNAGEKKLNLKNQVPEDTFVHADINMLKTILRNLIANGIKFSDPGGDISVTAVTNEHEVEVSVTDQGVGIEKDALDQIMDKKNTYTTQGTRGEKGSGLGLDLCIDFIEKHNGEIWVDSEPGKGSTFTFTLPVNI